MSSIFTPPPAPPAISPAQRAANQLIGSANGLLQRLAAVLAKDQATFWSNPDATPDAINAALGAQAAEVFQCAAAAQAFLNQVLALTPGTKIVQPNTFAAPRAATINADSTVTLAAVASG